MKQNLTRKPLVLALGVAILSMSAVAQTTQPQVVEKVEVTGSNIKRVDTETVSPVTVITREQIERSGQVTVGDLLRNIPANSGGSYGESFSNSFAPGAAGISLRGLGQKATLVLINGRRTASYGFAQNLQDTFVDLNSLPTSVVERIEVLRDGASAIYGSDAIAGVVNVILRKDNRDIDIGLSGGFFEGKKEYRFNLSGGFGDLGKDRFNVMGAFDYYKRDLLMLNETEFGKTRDFRSQQGGRNFQSLTGGGTWRQTNAAGTANTNNYLSSASCRGTVMTGAQAVAAGLIGAPAGNTALNIAGNTFCTQDFNNEFTALPGTERFGFLSRGTFDIGSNLSAFAELGLARVNTEQKFQDPFFAGTTGLQQTVAGLRPFTYNINFNPGVSGNPFPTIARYVGVLGDMGTRDTNIQSDTIRFLAGLKYSFAGFDGDSAIGWSRNSVEAENLNRLSLSGVSRTFGVSAAPQPPIPTSTATAYNLNNFTTNSQAVRDGLRANWTRKSDSELKFVDTKLSTEFGKLEGGAIGVAMGAEYRQESIKDRPQANALSGDILGQGTTATDGSRSNTALFTELSLPFTRSLEGQIAVRHDRYNDFGSSTNPKAGFKFKISPEAMIRANWGTGFRAPSLPENSNSSATFFTQITDPANNNVATQISGVYSGNPKLKPETSQSFTIGAVFEPVKDWNFGIDYYDLTWKNIVGADTFQSLVNAGGPAVIRDPSTNLIVTVLNGYRNLSSITTSGYDVDMKYTLPRSSFGKVTMGVQGSYIESYVVEGTEYVGTNGYNSIPRFRARATLDWDYDRLNVTAAVNYIHSYEQVLLPASYFTAQDPAFQNGVYPDRVRKHMTYDLFARYNVTPKLSVNFSVLNLTNQLPPYDPGVSTTFLYDFTQYDIRGRIFRAGLRYKFN